MNITPHLKRKFLVIVDGTPESRTALRFAARRAHGTGGEVCLLLVLEVGGFEHWLGVESLMKEEAREEAAIILTELSDMVCALGCAAPTTHIREGKIVEEIENFLDEDRTISTLVLATSSDSEAADPGPLISQFTRGRRGLHNPLIVVPGTLSDAEIDALT